MNRFLSRIGLLSTAITNQPWCKNGRFRAVRYNRVWLFSFLVKDFWNFFLWYCVKFSCCFPHTHDFHYVFQSNINDWTLDDAKIIASKMQCKYKQTSKWQFRLCSNWVLKSTLSNQLNIINEIHYKFSHKICDPFPLYERDII